MADAKGQTMLAIERKNEILQKLRAEQRVLVSELAAHYQVTEETIRRDLDKLEKEGYATKTYGGAILGNSTKTDLSHAIRSKTNVEFKNQIADLVCQMVDDGDHLMIDDSSTALFCAKKLRDKKNLTIITNSVELVVELANVETWSILLTGGRLKAESLALVGSQCEKYLGNYHVDKVFVSCKGLDREAGVTDSNELNAQAKQAMLRAGRQKILVVDSSKIDKVSFVNITPVSAMNLACAMKSPLRVNSPTSVKMSPPLPKPKSYQSCFATFTRKEGVRSLRYGARYHSSFPLLRTGSCPSRARKSAMGICLIFSMSVRSMRRVS